MEKIALVFVLNLLLQNTRNNEFETINLHKLCEWY